MVNWLGSEVHAARDTEDDIDMVQASVITNHDFHFEDKDEFISGKLKEFTNTMKIEKT